MNKDIQEFRRKFSTVFGYEVFYKDSFKEYRALLSDNAEEIETFWLQKMKEHDQDIIKELEKRQFEEPYTCGINYSLGVISRLFKQ